MTGSVEPRGMRTAGAVRGLASALVWAAVLALALSTAGLVLGSHDAAKGRNVAHMSRLPLSTTSARIPSAPRDPATQQSATTSGEVVHPRHVVALFRAPGGRAFAKVGPRQFGPTWLPVVARHGAWSRVLLPSRPNGSTGWLRTAAVQRRHTPYLVRVHVASHRLDLTYEGQPVDSWPVAVGAPATPPPTGRPFVLGAITDPAQSYSPVILPLGTHSNTLDSYGGGPGTVALHGWPDASVFGTAASHGCVRVPSEALDHLTKVPLGTVVLLLND